MTLKSIINIFPKAAPYHCQTRCVPARNQGGSEHGDYRTRTEENASSKMFLMTEQFSVQHLVSHSCSCSPFPEDLSKNCAVLVTSSGCALKFCHIFSGQMDYELPVVGKRAETDWYVADLEGAERRKSSKL